MTRIKSLFALALTGAIIASCSTSNNVVSNHLISKRKFNKGFHINKKGHFSSSKEETMANNNEKEERSYQIESTESESALAQSNQKENNTVNNSADKNSVEYTSYENNNTLASTDGDLSDEFESDSYGTDDSYTGSVQRELKDDREESGEESQQAAPAAPAPSSTGDIILAIILCLFLPPLGLLIYRGVDSIFWIDLILFLVAIGGFFFLPFVGLAGLVAVVLAFLGVWDVI